MNGPPETMVGRWLHSHEEDSADQMILRPVTFRFPPSRGRAGFELRADGSYVDIGIAPADGVQETQGTWTFENDVLTLHCEAYSGGSRSFAVTAVDEDRIALAK
jgi:hypothetical protein